MHRPPHILVLSASVGAGHLRAAQAVELALREMTPDAVIHNIDVLELTNSAFRRIYGRTYLDLVNNVPHLLGYFYDMMDQPRRPNSTRDKLRVAVEKMNLGKFMKLIESTEWDLAINTHFLPAEIIASMRNKMEIQLPQMTVTTDFETHRLWVNQPCDHYFTATEEGAWYLRSFGVPAEDISVTGIPIHPVFARPVDQGECRKLHGIVGDRPVLLQLAGGFGVGPVKEIFSGLLAVEQPVELVVITGKNQELRQELAALPVNNRHRVHILGYTDKMDELMAAADIVVSKPGGLTTSEVLARGAAMVVVNPIPGQESRNSDYILENGAAIKVNNIPTLPNKISALLADPDRLNSLRHNARRIGNPRAAYHIAQAALSFVENSSRSRALLPASASFGA